MSRPRRRSRTRHPMPVDLTNVFDAAMDTWAGAMDLRVREAEGHTRRVTELTLRLARRLGVREDRLVYIARGALLHDIGRMRLPDEVLVKPGAFTDEEWALMRQHPVHAYELLSPIVLPQALEIPYAHHEKWDATGYPRGLKKERIPLAARIFAVADVWDALLSPRPYRPARSKEEALLLIKEQAHAHFDPEVVEAFLKIIDEESA